MARKTEMMTITSSAENRLKKILQGSVFSSSDAFILELIQNAQRASATQQTFVLDGDTLSIQDNGTGCKNPANLLTLDFSSWESTSEGFGMGFWSILAIPELEKLEVQSSGWTATLSPEQIKNGDLDVQICETDNSHQGGFSIYLKSEYFRNHSEAIRNAIEKNGRYIPIDFQVIDNGQPWDIVHRDIFSDFRDSSAVTEEYVDNKLFKGYISIAEYSWSSLTLFYENRKVKDLYIPHVSGVLSLKPSAIGLKEPDRTEVIYDDRFNRFEKKVKSIAQAILKQYLLRYGLENRIAEAVARYLDVKDYEKFLDLPDAILETGENPESQKEKPSSPTTEQENGEDKQLSFIEEEDDSFEFETNCPEESFQEENSEVVVTPVRERAKPPQKMHVSAETSPSDNMTAAIPKESKIKAFLRKNKNVVYVMQDEDEYEDEIAKARYAGLIVFVCHNKLYSNVMRKYGIPHIRDCQECLTTKYVKKNVCLKRREAIFMDFLMPITTLFDIPIDTFRIADLESTIEFVVDGKVRYKKKLKNKKDHIQLYGITDRLHGKVYLDRTMLKLSAFKLTKGKYDTEALKAVMNAINTIAHELAHLLYGTVDDTVAHYHAEVQIQQKLMDWYLNYH